MNSKVLFSSPAVYSKKHTVNSFVIPNQPCNISTKEFAYLRSGDSLVLPRGNYLLTSNSHVNLSVTGKTYVCQSILSVPNLFNLQ